MKKVKLRKIGNSIGIIIPSEVIADLNLKEGEEVYIEKDSESIIINKELRYPKVSPQFLKLAEKVATEYDATFKDLVNK